MSAGWARDEVETAVAAYFGMLRAELSGTRYSKTEHRRRLLPLLQGRSEQSVEFKHANISAILIELGFPFISGYKPRSNYQGLLYEVVSDQLAGDSAIHKLAAADTVQPATIPTVDDILKALTDSPKPVALKNRVAAPSASYSATPVNYLEREANNRSLGLAGEEFVINFEQSGADRLIEVKTTKYGAHTPFFVSRNELEVSKTETNRYHLYRVFDFRERPLLFTLHGALSSTCTLDPTNYIARVG